MRLCTYKFLILGLLNGPWFVEFPNMVEKRDLVENRLPMAENKILERTTGIPCNIIKFIFRSLQY